MHGASTSDAGPGEGGFTGGEEELLCFLDNLISATVARRMSARAAETLHEGLDGVVDADGPADSEPPRTSMREGLAVLFRSTERPSPSPPPAGDATSKSPSAPTPAPVPGAAAPGSETVTAAEPDGEEPRAEGPRRQEESGAEVAPELAPPTGEPSIYMRRFLQQMARSPELASSGLSNLDARLDGGFGSGLHLVVGRRGVGKTAFLESVAWEAIASDRPVLYYALREGSLGAWERLVSAFGTLLGGPALALGALRSRTLDTAHLETLVRLDSAFQVSVMPCLSLLENIPAGTNAVSALIDDILSRVEQERERCGRTALVLIDDLERLLLITRARPLSHLLSHLDDGLVEGCIPALLAVNPSARLQDELDRLPSQTTLALVPVADSGPDGLQRLDLELRANSRTGWTGRLPLLLDRDSGLFAPPPVGG